jgi:hypothetical protein
MGRLLLDDAVHTDYGQFDIEWSRSGFDGDFDKYFRGQVNGLVGAAHPEGVYLHLARPSGGSRVRLVHLDAEPPPPTTDVEDVVEVSLNVPEGASVRWSSWAGETSGSLPGIAPGPHRLRVSARGRDAGRDAYLAEDDVGIVDDYLLELWPARPAEDAILLVGSEDARYWHREVGGRR